LLSWFPSGFKTRDECRIETVLENLKNSEQISVLKTRYHIWNVVDQAAIPLKQRCFKVDTIHPNHLGIYDVFYYLATLCFALKIYVSHLTGTCEKPTEFVSTVLDLTARETLKNAYNCYRQLINRYIRQVINYQLRMYFESAEYGAQYKRFADEFWRVFNASKSVKTKIESTHLPSSYSIAFSGN
jgi:hypothetical protein